MRFTTIAAAMAVLACVVGVSAASAAPVQVSLPLCYFANGGQATVPAGTDVTTFFGWSEPSKGLASVFTSSQTTTATLNGNPVANASSLWGTPVSLAPDFWAITWRLHVGTLASAGDQATVTFQISLPHKLPSGVDPNTGQQIFAPPGNQLPSGFSCTITAV